MKRLAKNTILLSLLLFVTACGTNNDFDREISIGDAVDYKIIGIEPGAGIMQLTKETLEQYENLQGWEVIESSTAGMLIELEEAINNEEPIIVTGWNPHFMFASFDIKYLEDPKGTYGEEETINTIVRSDLQKDMPSAYELLDRFYWEPEDMESIMLEQEQGTPFEEAAQNWIETNRDRVDEWLDGIEEVEGESIELIATPWDSEFASAEVMKALLEEIGYEVTITPVDPAIMIQAIATGEGDASLAPWLPITHGSFYEAYEGQFIDLGPNLVGAKVGLAVPTYVDIVSIEDLEPKQ